MMFPFGIFCSHTATLAHMFERQSELSGFLTGSFLRPQQAFQPGKDDRGQNKAGEEVHLQRRG
jgi:hypothetical protein